MKSGNGAATGATTTAPTSPTPIPALASETLRGDLRDRVLSEFRQVAKPWSQMTEAEQERLIHRAEDIAGELVASALAVVAARGLPVLPITVGKFTVDGGDVKGNFGCYASDENLLRVRHLADRPALFVLVDPADYGGERKPALPDNVGDLAMPKGADKVVFEEVVMTEYVTVARADEPQLQNVGKGAGKKRGKKAAAMPPVADLPNTADVSQPPFGLPDVPTEPRVTSGEDIPQFLDRRAT